MMGGWQLGQTLGGFQRTLDRVRDVISLALVALAAAMVAAVIGVGSLWAGNVISSGDLWSSWRVC